MMASRLTTSPSTSPPRATNTCFAARTVPFTEPSIFTTPSAEMSPMTRIPAPMIDSPGTPSRLPPGAAPFSENTAISVPPSLDPSDRRPFRHVESQSAGAELWTALSFQTSRSPVLPELRRPRLQSAVTCDHTSSHNLTDAARGRTDRSRHHTPPPSLSLPPMPALESPEGRRSEEHTSELQSPCNLVCRLLLEKKKKL